MFYNVIKAPVIIKTGTGILKMMDELLKDAHLYFPKKILITQENLYNSYEKEFGNTEFHEIIYVKGGHISETESIIEHCKNEDALLIAFGGGSVIDVVKYSASRIDKPYITIPSALSNDAIYSCVARLTKDGKKVSLGVQPPIGILVDIDIIKNSPRILMLAGIADLVSNLSAIQDWLLAYKNIGEPINELSYMLAKEAAVPILRYSEKDLFSDALILDLVNGLITSGLSMIISGNTRGTSGAEHLISHAIDEYFPNMSTIHGLQVGWAHAYIDGNLRSDIFGINEFFKKIGLTTIFDKNFTYDYSMFSELVPYAKKVRNRYTILNTL